MSVKISDVWNCAYLLINGVQIDNVEVINNNEKLSVYFVLSGKDAEKLDLEFKTGKASANITQLKLTVTHLKDLMFDKLRETNDQRNLSKQNFYRKGTRNETFIKRNYQQSQNF